MSFARNIKIVHVVNRTTKQLEATWDGYTYLIPPGFKVIEDAVEQPKLNAKGNPMLDAETKEPILETVKVQRIVGNTAHEEVFRYPMPYFAAEAAMRQNPKLGTLNHLNPNDFEPLICVPEWGHPIVHTEQNTDAIELLDRDHMDPERRNVTHQFVPGSRRSTQKTSRYSMYGGRQSLGHSNPFGMEMKGEASAGGATFGE